MNHRNRILLAELVRTDFKLRYQGSVLGYIWSLLKPLLLFAILYVVFVHFLRFNGWGSYPALKLLLGVVLWTFFTEATNQGMQAIVARGDLIRKVNFPKYIIVISGTISALINLTFNLMVVVIFMAVSGVQPHWIMLGFLAVIVEVYILSLAIAFLLSSVYVKYRDVGHIWDVILQGLFYATPIIYPIAMIGVYGNWVAQVLILSPVAQIIQDARYTLIAQDIDTLWSLVSSPALRMVPFGIIAVIGIVAIIHFRRNQAYFAENV